MYDNNQNGFNNNRVPPYGAPNNNFANEFMLNERRKRLEKSEIRILGTLTGAAILSVFLLQNVIIGLLYVFGLYDSYLYNGAFQMGADMLITVLTILVPFLIFGKIMKQKSGTFDLVPLGKPKDRKLSLLAVPAGLGICMAANMATSYIIVFLKIFGIELSSPELSDPSGASGFIISVLRVSVIAALVEEISLRGCAMQPLRKFGDGFAITMSACAFGLMHCNLIQAPFALIVGLGLGYICVKTDSLWLAIIVHALNNLISTCFSYMLGSSMSEAAVNAIYNFAVYFIMIFGLISLLFFSRRARAVWPIVPSRSILTTAQKTGAYILNPTMIIAIILMLFYTSQFVNFG